MKALLLAAGYATRLFPLTENRAKGMLPVGGRPMLDWIADKIDEVAVVDELHVVTNARFAADVSPGPSRARAGSRRSCTTTERPRTTTGWARSATSTSSLRRAGLAGDDLFVVAGDNLFEFSLADYVAWWSGLGEASAVAVRDCGDPALATQYAVIGLDGDGRVTSFVEKPPSRRARSSRSRPTSTTASTCR